MISIASLFGGTCGDRTHLVLIKSQVPLRFGIGSKTELRPAVKRYAAATGSGAGFEPAHLLGNSQAHFQFCYPRITWWAITDSNCALSIKNRVLRRQSL